MTTFKVRQPTQVRRTPWPFLYTVVPGRGIVRNVQPGAQHTDRRRQGPLK